MTNTDTPVVAWRWEEQFMGVWRDRLTHERPEDGPRVRSVEALGLLAAAPAHDDLRERVAQIVEDAIERHDPRRGITRTIGDADAILALIQRSPENG